MKTKILQKTFLSFIGLVLVSFALSPRMSAADHNHELVSTIAFSSTRDYPTADPPLFSSEIYLMDPDGTNLRRLTDNIDGEFFAALSPGGKKIVFDSNRRRLPDEPLNTSDLFVMDPDGADQTFLIRGSSATWSPDSKYIAYHASASGTGLPTTTNPGAATPDSDIFVANVDDLLAGMAQPQNVTNSPYAIDNDPEWAPDGTRIVFTSHSASDPDPSNPSDAEIYVINPDGTGLTRLTFNNYEERAPSWSPDGSRIVFIGRVGTHPGVPGSKFEICVMNADGTGFVQLTDNAMFDGTPTFSSDGQQIVFSRNPPPQQMWIMNADGTGEVQLTFPPGWNLFADWGVLRVHVH